MSDQEMYLLDGCSCHVPRSALVEHLEQARVLIRGEAGLDECIQAVCCPVCAGLVTHNDAYSLLGGQRLGCIYQQLTARVSAAAAAATELSAHVEGGGTPTAVARARDGAISVHKAVQQLVTAVDPTADPAPGGGGRGSRGRGAGGRRGGGRGRGGTGPTRTWAAGTGYGGGSAGYWRSYSGGGSDTWDDTAARAAQAAADTALAAALSSVATALRGSSAHSTSGSARGTRPGVAAGGPGPLPLAGVGVALGGELAWALRLLLANDSLQDISARQGVYRPALDLLRLVGSQMELLPLLTRPAERPQELAAAAAAAAAAGTAGAAAGGAPAAGGGGGGCGGLPTLLGSLRLLGAQARVFQRSAAELAEGDEEDVAAVSMSLELTSLLEDLEGAAAAHEASLGAAAGHLDFLPPPPPAAGAGGPGSGGGTPAAGQPPPPSPAANTRGSKRPRGNAPPAAAQQPPGAQQQQEAAAAQQQRQAREAGYVAALSPFRLVEADLVGGGHYFKQQALSGASGRNPYGMHAGYYGGGPKKGGSSGGAAAAAAGGGSGQGPGAELMRKRNKRITSEVATLATSLPIAWDSAVLLAVDASRLDLLRALVLPPGDTPYGHGAFEFDIWLPPEYPEVPPRVQFLTTGGGSVRFNPNLYNCGKVCLSLLGTWNGPGWDPAHSTLLQVLVSLQSMVFVADPYYNEPGHEMRANKAAATSYNTQLQLATAQVAIEAPLTKLVGGEPGGGSSNTTSHAGGSSSGGGGGGAQAAGAGSSGAGGSGMGQADILGTGADGNIIKKSSKKGKGPSQAPDSVYLPPKTAPPWLPGGGGSYPVFTPSYAAMLPGPVGGAAAAAAAGAAAAGGGGSSSSGKPSVFAEALRLHWALKAEEVKATLGRWADAAAAGEVKTRLQQVAGRVAAALARLPPPGQQQQQGQQKELGQQQEPQQGQDVGDWQQQQQRYQQQQPQQQQPPKPQREEVVMLDDSDDSDDEAAREVLTPPKRARRAGPAAPPQVGAAAAGPATSTEAVSAAYMAAVAATAAAERAAAAAQQAVIHLSQEQQLGMAGMGGGVGASSAGPAGRVGRGGGRGAPDDAGILDLTGWEEDMMSGEVGEAGGAPPPGAAAAPALAGEGEVEVLDLT